MSDPVGLVVLVTDGEDYALAGTRLHDETSIEGALDQARQFIAQSPAGMFRPGTTLAVGEVRVREASRADAR